MTTQSPDWQALAVRLNKLERANRRWRTAATASLLLISLVLLLGAAVQTVPDEIRAKAFVVTDSKGNSLGRVGISSGGSPDIFLNGGRITIAKLEGNGRVGKGLVAISSEGIFLEDKEQRYNAILATDLEGPGLSFGSGAQIVARFGLKPDGSPQIRLDDETGETRAVLGRIDLQDTVTGTVLKRPASSLILFDKDGKVLWRVP